VNTHAHAWRRTHTRGDARTRVETHAHAWRRTHTRVHTHAHAWRRTHTRVHTHAHARTRVHTHAHVQLHVRMRVHTRAAADVGQLRRPSLKQLASQQLTDWQYTVHADKLHGQLTDRTRMTVSSVRPQY